MRIVDTFQQMVEQDEANKRAQRRLIDSVYPMPEPKVIVMEPPKGPRLPAFVQKHI